MAITGIFGGNIVDSHEGACFSVKSDDGECFKVRTSESECFYIKSDEDDKLDYPPHEISIPGFTEIWHIQAHGLNEFIVTGKYIPNKGDDEIEIIAKMIYIGGNGGGISDILAVYFYNELSNIDLSLSNIARIDGYDVDSTIGSICLVLNDFNVIWLNDTLFTIDNDTRNFESYNGGASLNPYFEEDTYWDDHLRSEVVEVDYPFNRWHKWINDDPTCTTSGEPTNPDDGNNIWWDTIGILHYYIETNNHSDNAITRTNRAYYYAHNIYDYVCGGCACDGVQSDNTTLSVYREGKVAILNGYAYTTIDTTPTFVSGGEGRVDEGSGDFIHTYEPVSDLLGIATSDKVFLGSNSGERVCVNSTLFANTEGDVLYWAKKDGSANGEESFTGSSDVTVIGGYIIQTDKSSIIKQVLLLSEE